MNCCSRCSNGRKSKAAIVFTRTRDRTDRVAKMLTREGIRAVPIHGDRSQGQRNAALAGFRAETFRVMVATDVAARGLDIQGVSHVINFDLPDEPDNYIPSHRPHRADGPRRLRYQHGDTRTIG